MVRRQLYIEAVKRHEAQLFAPVLIHLEKIVQTELIALPVQTLAQLTKKQLDAVIKRVRDEYNKALNEYVEEHKTNLEQIAKADLVLTGGVVATLAADLPVASAKPSIIEFIDTLTNVGQAILDPTNSFVDGVLASLWNDPNAALGSYMEYFLGDHITRISHGVLDLIRKAYVDALSPYQAILSIVGTPTRNYRDGFLNRVWNWNKAVVNTNIQHVTSVVSRELFKGMFDRYIWISVIDEVTSKICRSRDGNIYVYGYGPIPPAHPNCRSTTSPLLGGEIPPAMPGFADWLAEQADELIEDTSGSVSANELPKKLGMILGISLTSRYIAPFIFRD